MMTLFDWDALRQDLRYSTRILARNPGFAAAAVLTLALGLGINTAMFSVVNEALLKPLPLPQPDQLTSVFNFNQETAKYLSTSYPDYQDLAARSRSFSQIAAYVRLPFDLKIGDETERIAGEPVSANYFSMLKLQPLIGRSFSAADGGSGAPVGMISEELWRDRFSSDPKAIGKIIQLDGQPVTLIGVVPRRYQGANLNWSKPPQIWIPIRTLPAFLPQFRALLKQRGSRWLLTLGRLRANATLPQAQAEMETLAANLAKAEPATNGHVSFRVFAASRAKFWPAYRNSVTQSLALFSGAAALVLLLACSNVSNLLMERALGRRREIAIRLSLGASRGRVLWQLMMDSFVLVALSLAVSLLFAALFQVLLLHLPRAFDLPLSLTLNLDTQAVFFCVLLASCMVVLCGLAPALQARRPDLAPALKGSSTSLSREGRSWLTNALVIVQVAFSMILLAGGGIFARTILTAYSTDPGFRSDHLLVSSLDSPGNSSGDKTLTSVLENAVSEVGQLAGVESATTAWEFPLSGIHSTIAVLPPAGQGAAPVPVAYNMVGTGYLHTMKIGLNAGRDFDSHDTPQSLRVAIINEEMAAEWWPHDNPVGRRLSVAQHDGNVTPVQVIGVARNSKYSSIWEQPAPYLYLPVRQTGLPFASSQLVIRTKVDPGLMARRLRKSWAALAPDVLLYDIQTGDQEVAASLAPQRFALDIFAAFSMLAALIAAIGLYSVLSNTLLRRTREIGIRMAIGARPASVVLQILKQAGALVAVGLGIGGALSAFLVRYTSAIAKAGSGQATTTISLVALFLIWIAAGAAFFPALRATRIDPVKALKHE